MTARPSLIKADRERREHALTLQAAVARQPVAHACSICGTSPAPFGYGDFLDGRPGVLHACFDRACRAACERRALSSETGRAA